MGWGSDLLSGIFGSLLGDDDIFSDERKNADAQFGNRKPGNYNNNNNKNKPNPNENLDEDIPEGQYTRVQNNKPRSTSSVNNKYSSSTNNRTYNTNTTKPNSRNYGFNKEKVDSNNSKQQNNNYYKPYSGENSDNYGNTKPNNYYNNFYNYNTEFKKDDNDSYWEIPQTESYQPPNYNSKIKRDKSNTASQSFRRQHGERNQTGYPTLSKKGSKTVSNDRASLTFGEPHFSTYDHGIRGIAFPYTLSVNNPLNRKIVVSGKFCNSKGGWIKSLMPDMADRYGDLVINESVTCEENTFLIDSYLFMPYGVLDLKVTQKIYLNIDVFVDGTGPQHLLRYVYGFDYYIYENDPREYRSPTGNAGGLSNKQTGFDELIGVISHVIKADGVCAPEEVRAVIDFFKKYNGVDKDYLKDRLKYKLANLSNLENDCQVIKNNFNTQTRLTFLALFFKISVSDEYVPSIELNLIEKISNLMGIAKSNFDSLKAEFLPASDNVWHVFGLTPKATKDQLKTAYREKCKQWHPDRFANASPEEYKKAEEKFKDLQDMYNFLLRKF